MTAWLLDGPETVTEFRNSDEASWYAAHGVEALLLMVGVVVAAHVVRSCLRQRRLTFDAMFCIAGGLSIWVDPTQNFLQPLFMYNSNFVNVESWCGHFPGVVNPDCGRIAEPILFLLPCYVFGLLGAAMVLNGYMRAVRRRWPDLSMAKFLGLTAAGALIIEIPLELTMVSLQVWSYPGSPSWMSLLGSGHRLPVAEFGTAVLFFAIFGAVRFLKDDSGRTMVERGVSRLRPGRQRVVTTLALCGVIQLAALQNNLSVLIPGLYASPYPELPPSLIIGMCDAPGFQATRYGPCPGAPGYRMPIHHLPQLKGW
jgi:hypothetical protein